MSKKVASKSHVDDAKGGHSKESQRPEPANQYTGSRTSLDVNEARDKTSKKKAAPANGGFHNRPNEERDSLNEAQSNRVSRPVPANAKEVPNGAAKARRAGPHGSVMHADGSSQAAPNKHNVART
jgi:hypothetical protein